MGPGSQPNQSVEGRARRQATGPVANIRFRREGKCLLDVRIAGLNETLQDTFRHRYPGFRPANSDKVIALAA